MNRYKQNTAKKRGYGQVDLALSELDECIPSAWSVEEVINQKELIRAIDTFLFDQSQERRIIFVRRYWYLSPIDEIAEDFSMSRSKVTSLLFRMRNELKLHLEKEGIHV